LSKIIQKPFLRWAGGKTWLLKGLSKHIPTSYNNYHEPFLGGGSVFFFLNPNNLSFLSDSNAELVNAFIQVKENVEDVIKVLKEYKNTKDNYYLIREKSYRNKVKQAARFIFLNRTGFNGIYRVNLKGKYNVPYGFKNYKNNFDFNLFRSASKSLENTKISSADFELTLGNIYEGDFVFIDPPYTVSHIKNGFIKYNEKLFSWEDQERLANYVNQIIEKGAYYLLTNAKHDSVENLYSQIEKPISVNRFSVIGGKNAKREPIQEFLFTNVKGIK
jgi:DNA adenine methylase